MRINILKKVARVESVQKQKKKKTSVSHSKYDLKKLVDRPPFEYVSTLPYPAQPSPVQPQPQRSLQIPMLEAKM